MDQFLKFVTDYHQLIIDSFLAMTFYIGMYFFASKVKLKLKQYMVFGGVYLVLFVSIQLGIDSIAIIAACILLLFIVTFALIFRNDLKKLFFSSNFKKTLPKIKLQNIKDEEKEQLLNHIVSALLTMSTDRIGAIITFEREQNLDEYLKKAVTIRSVVTSELLLTIFYPGTALHDGAVVIRGNKIEAAAVYFTLSTKILSGRYGARHRAAVGIAEASDAITFVVSEETGRISYSQDGELEPMNRDNLHKMIKDLLEF